MRNLAEHKKILREEIIALLDRLNTHRSNIHTEEPAAFDKLMPDLLALQNKTATLQFLHSLPEEKETVIVPFIPAAHENIPVNEPLAEAPKKEEPVILPKEKPAEPVFVPVAPAVNEVPKKEEPVSIPKEKPAEPVIIPVPEKTVPPPPAAKKKNEIRSFIGFNEKIMFMRNLFKNDLAAYDEALNQINACASLNEAETFLSVLKNEYSWDANKEAVQIFMETVKRLFA